MAIYQRECDGDGKRYFDMDSNADHASLPNNSSNKPENKLPVATMSIAASAEGGIYVFRADTDSWIPY